MCSLSWHGNARADSQVMLFRAVSMGGNKEAYKTNINLERVPEEYLHIDFGLVFELNDLVPDCSCDFADVKNLASSESNLQSQRPYFFTVMIILVQSIVP